MPPKLPTETLLPREKLAKFGLQNLENWELLAILLRTGTKSKDVFRLSQEILESYDLGRFSSLTLEELSQIEGINSAKASTILASLELSRRILNKPEILLPVIAEAKDAVLACPELNGQKREILVALYLNARSELVHKETISLGSHSQVSLNPMDVFHPAIRHLAGFMILLHNHPSGHADPSEEDILLTKKLIEAGKLLGVEVLDHLVVGKNQFKSVIEFL